MGVRCPIFARSTRHRNSSGGKVHGDSGARDMISSGMAQLARAAPHRSEAFMGSSGRSVPLGHDLVRVLPEEGWWAADRQQAPGEPDGVGNQTKRPSGPIPHVLHHGPAFR